MAHYGRNRLYQRVCKVEGCGKARYELERYALCEEHYLEYMRDKVRAYRLRKRGVVHDRRGRPCKAG